MLMEHRHLFEKMDLTTCQSVFFLAFGKWIEDCHLLDALEKRQKIWDKSPVVVAQALPEEEKNEAIEINWVEAEKLERQAYVPVKKILDDNKPKGEKECKRVAFINWNVVLDHFFNAYYKIGEEIELCSICHENIEQKIPQVKCRAGHRFHLACLGKAMLTKAECPYCKISMMPLGPNDEPWEPFSKMPRP